MKIIGITQRTEKCTSYEETRDTLDQCWTSFCEAFGALLIPIPNLLSDVTGYIKGLKLDGLILSGGNDDLKRNAIEEQIIHEVIEKNLPLLGVCHGMQILTRFFGGSVVPIDGHRANSHKIYSSVASYGFFQQEEIVNSFHEFGIRKTPKNFTCLACDIEGNCEAMEHQQKPILACMWHPEREVPFSRQRVEFLKHFFQKNDR